MRKEIRDEMLLQEIVIRLREFRKKKGVSQLQVLIDTDIQVYWKDFFDGIKNQEIPDTTSIVLRKTTENRQSRAPERVANGMCGAGTVTWPGDLYFRTPRPRKKERRRFKFQVRPSTPFKRIIPYARTCPIKNRAKLRFRTDFAFESIMWKLDFAKNA